MHVIVPTTRVRAPWWTVTVATIAAVLVLLGVNYAFNVALSNAAAIDLDPMFGVLSMLPLPFLAGLVIISSTLVLGLISNQKVAWYQVVAAYFLTSLAHLLSGLWAIYSLSTDGVPGAGEAFSLKLNFNFLGWSGGLGAFLNHLTVDEAIHLTLYGLVVGWLYNLKPPARTVLVIALLASWIILEGVLTSFFPSMPL